VEIAGRAEKNLSALSALAAVNVILFNPKGGPVHMTVVASGWDRSAF
jgi:hypothetical protein